MQKKVVIVLSKEEAKELLHLGELDYPPTRQIEEQLAELEKPEPNPTINIGSAQFNVKKEHCPKCGHQIYPVIESVRCRDCDWKGFDKDLIYKPTEQGGESYQNHCPECDGVKIKRLKDDKQGCVQPI